MQRAAVSKTMFCLKEYLKRHPDMPSETDKQVKSCIKLCKKHCYLEKNGLFNYSPDQAKIIQAVESYATRQRNCS